MPLLPSRMRSRGASSARWPACTSIAQSFLAYQIQHARTLSPSILLHSPFPTPCLPEGALPPCLHASLPPLSPPFPSFHFCPTLRFHPLPCLQTPLVSSTCLPSWLPPHALPRPLSLRSQFMLKGRSPWISGQSSSVDGVASDIEHNRARSLSFASVGARSRICLLHAHQLGCFSGFCTCFQVHGSHMCKCDNPLIMHGAARANTCPFMTCPRCILRVLPTL